MTLKDRQMILRDNEQYTPAGAHPGRLSSRREEKYSFRALLVKLFVPALKQV